MGSSGVIASTGVSKDAISNGPEDLSKNVRNGLFMLIRPDNCKVRVRRSKCETRIVVLIKILNIRNISIVTASAFLGGRSRNLVALVSNRFD